MPPGDGEVGSPSEAGGPAPTVAGGESNDDDGAEGDDGADGVTFTAIEGSGGGDTSGAPPNVYRRRCPRWP